MADTTQILTRQEHLERIKILALRLQNGQFKTPVEAQEAKQAVLNFANEYGLATNLPFEKFIESIISSLNSLLSTDLTATTVPTTLPELLKELEAAEQETKKQQQVDPRFAFPSLQKQLELQTQFYGTLFKQLRDSGLKAEEARLAAEQTMRDLTTSKGPISPQSLPAIIATAIKKYAPNSPVEKIVDKVVSSPVIPEKVIPPKVETQPVTAPVSPISVTNIPGRTIFQADQRPKTATSNKEQPTKQKPAQTYGKPIILPTTATRPIYETQKLATTPEPQNMTEVISNTVRTLGFAPAIQPQLNMIAVDIATKIRRELGGQRDISNVISRLEEAIKNAGLQPVSREQLNKLAGLISSPKITDINHPSSSVSTPTAAVVGMVRPEAGQEEERTPRNYLQEQILHQLTALPTLQSNLPGTQKITEKIIQTIEEKPDLLTDSPQSQEKYQKAITTILGENVPKEEQSLFIANSKKILQTYIEQLNPSRQQVTPLTTPINNIPINTSFFARLSNSGFITQLANTGVGMAIKKGFNEIKNEFSKTALKAGAKKAIAALGKVIAGIAGIDPEPLTKILLLAAAWIGEKIIFPLLVKLKKKAHWLLPIGLGLFFLPALITFAPLIGIIIGGAGAILAGVAAGKEILNLISGTQVNGLISKGVMGLKNTLGSIFWHSGSTAGINTISTVAVTGSLGSTAVLTLFTMTALIEAFYLPSTERMAPFDSNSQYIQVEKSVSFNGKPVTKLANSDLTDASNLTFTIAITANGADLTNIKISDITTSSQQAGGYTVADKQWDNIADISKGGTYSFEYPISTNPVYKFQDAAINNTVIVTATANTVDSSGQATTIPDQKSSTQVNLIIGNPPEDCPMGWPVSQPYTITQEPGDSYSHSGIEAIDIAVGIGSEIRATHAGTAITDYTEHSILGKYVTVQGICKGKVFSSIYAHLQSVSIKNGDSVHVGTPLGLSGNTGRSTGPHLHYQLIELKMRDYLSY